MSEEERPREIGARGGQRRACGGAPALGHEERRGVDGPEGAPGCERIDEILPHRAQGARLWHRSRHDACRDQGRELPPIAWIPRAEPRVRTRELPETRVEQRGQRTLHEERL